MPFAFSHVCRKAALLVFLLSMYAFSPGQSCYDPGMDTVAVSGELKRWHNITLSFDGPYASETCIPNPFLDYRLNVTFVHQTTGKVFTIPGYFAADGNASETSADSGHTWRCHFSPDELGQWNWTASFRSGTGVAIDADSTAGTATDFDGLSGSLTVGPTDKTGIDLRSKGRLDYVGERYLKFAGSGEYFLKVGADAPENFLAYDDFDNTTDFGGRRKSWSPHVNDWNTGDPEWQGGKGHGIIGAINYLASEGMNVFSFLVNNIDGDDDNVFPFIAHNDQASPQDDRMRYDVSKLDQWEIVFAHGESKGMYLHFKLCETENDQLLDGGYLGTERKLFFREIMARFGHHLALNWNMGEENDLWDELNDPNNLVLISWMKYFHKHDPYHHHIVAHSYPQQKDQMYEPLLGVDSSITGASVQTGWHQVHEHTLDWLQASADSGIQWVVCNDEQGSAYQGVPPYDGYQGFVKPSSCPSHDDIRWRTVWGSLMAGGGGVEFYFGYSLPQNDLDCEDYRSRDSMWDYTRYAQKFFVDYLEFDQMQSDDDLVSRGYCFKKDGEKYVWYLSDASQTSFINIPGAGSYQMYWYNPRTGGALVPDQVMTAGSQFYQPTPPSAITEDWVLYFVSTALVFPVELGHFDATSDHAQVQLSWSTLQEVNADKFVIERSLPGKTFVPIGEIKAKENSSVRQNYGFDDLAPQTGTIHYRLRVVDLDGKWEYSSVEEVEITEPGWRVYPQPTMDVIHLDLPASLLQSAYSVRLFSVTGQLIKEWKLYSPQPTIQLLLPDLIPGQYYLEAQGVERSFKSRIQIGE